MSTKKNIPTQVTIENLLGELKKKFTSQATDISKAIKSGKVEGNTVNLYTSTDATGTAAFAFDFPAELVLDQAKTGFQPDFVWSEETYPGSTNPNLDGDPVLVMAVKGEANSVTYSFLNMERLMNIYKVKTEGKDPSTLITIDGYTIDVKVEVSGQDGNALQSLGDGLYVASPKVSGATAGNLAGLAADGSLTDSGKKPADFVEKIFVEGVEDAVLHESDIKDYTADEIAALLNGTPTA